MMRLILSLTFLAALALINTDASPLAWMIIPPAALAADLFSANVLIWQDPRIYFYGGLYLKIGNKRYRIVKVTG